MKPIIRWTLKQRKWSTLWWSIGVTSFVLVNMVFYPSFKSQAAELEKSFANLPSTAVQFIGGSTDFFSPVGFLNSQIFFLMLPLMCGVLAIGLGSSLLAREEQDGTVESLLARPVSRNRLLASKAWAGTCILAIVSTCSTLAVVISGKVVGLPISALTITATSFVCFLLCLSFGAFSYLITSLGKARGASVGLGACLALGGYIINSLAGTVGWLHLPAKLLPFHYYQPDVLLRGQYEWAHALYFVGLIALCAVGAWLGFRRRDIG